MESRPQTFSKGERICAKRDISNLLARGRWASNGAMRYCYTPCEAPSSRIMISVSKRFFKRAVKRNLLKRRIREAFRTQKWILEGICVDILFVYKSNEVLSSEAVASCIREALEDIRASYRKPSSK